MRRWWKPHIRQLRHYEFIGDEVPWMCEGEGVWGSGSTPAQAFDRWQWQKRINAEQKFAGSFAGRK